MLIKKKLLSSISLLLFIFCFLCSLIYLQKKGAEKEFTQLSGEILRETYEKDSLSTHFAFQNPAQFGIDTSQIQFPCYERTEYEKEESSARQTLSALQSLKTDALSDEARETYEILLETMENRMEGFDYLYFEEPLSPTSGIHSSLPVLLAEYAMDSKEDVESYLGLLEQIPVYFESLAAFEADKAAAGMFMAAQDVDIVISQCDFMASESGAKLFAACFAGQLKNVYKLGSDEFSYYQSAQKRIFDTLVAPAYKKLGDALYVLKEDGKQQEGLCQYERGRNYYEYRIRTLIGTDKSCDEIAKILENRTADLYVQLASLYRAYNKAAGHVQSTTGEELTGSGASDDSPTDINDYLPALERDLKQDFPSLPQTSQVTIKQIPQALLAYTAPAYYFIPRIQMCRPGNINNIENTIYYSSNACADPISLYTTLAHEGFPGHMYQNIYFIASHGVSEANVLRYSLDFPGYSEGWAMYIELLAYERAGTFTNSDEIYCKMLRLSREIQLCVLCYLDIQIHANHATITDIAPFLSKIGVKEPDTVYEVYSYLVNEPGTYLKYYMGYLELLECKELYQKCCETAGGTYTELAFHTFLLEHGPDSYTRIRRKIAETDFK